MTFPWILEIRTFDVNAGGFMKKSAVVVNLLVGLILIATAVVASRKAEVHSIAQPANLRWYKGNTHTHTLNSDGDSTPLEVATWYREHGYNFLVLSDHNFLTSPDGLNAAIGADERFLLVRGEEVTDEFKGKSVHINSLFPQKLVLPQGGTSVFDTMQKDVNAIREARGVPHINHPNFQWSITTDDLIRLQNDRLFEIYNGHPEVNNLGGGGVPGLEEIWDAILSSGKLMHGIAVDDAHHFKRPWDARASKPGKGWIYVRAPKLDAAELMAALEKGDFYASTGIELSALEAGSGRLYLKIKPASSSKYRIQFIGKGGRVLAESTSQAAEYQLKDGDAYVRARVLESNGAQAWTQPVMGR